MASFPDTSPARIRRCAWCQHAIDPADADVSALSEVILAHDTCLSGAWPAGHPDTFLPAHRPPLLRAVR